MGTNGARGTLLSTWGGGEFYRGLQKPEVAKIFIKSISAFWVFGILLPPMTYL